MSAIQFRVLTAIALSMIVSLQARAALNDSIVAAWLFDEGQGTVAADSVGDHDGQLEGAIEWTADGMFGAALSFLGEPFSYVEVPHQDDLSLDTWTITAWVKLQPPIANPDEWAVVLVKDPANGLQNYALDMNPAGNVFAEVTAAGAWSDCRSVTTVYDDQWHFLTGSYDGEILQVYVDGEFEGDQPFDPGDQSDAPVLIGDRLTGTQPVYGLIDDVAVFNEALAEQDIQQLMDQGLKSALALGGVALQAGDADQDLDFDQLDLVKVQIAGKYLTNQAATWGDGDWNGAPGGAVGNPPAGNGAFDQLDIIAALSAGKYLTGPYAAIAAGGERDDDQASQAMLAGDLTVVGSLAGGGDLGTVDLVVVPEPSALWLVTAGGLAVLAARRARRR